MTQKSERPFTRDELEALADLSRAYHEARPDILAALVQLMRQEQTPDWRAEVAQWFGLSVEEAVRYRPDEVKALHRGFVRRAQLFSARHVYTRILQEIESGSLRPGDQLPPRTRFTEVYRCDKATHQEVVTRLMKNGVVHRPGGAGGPLYVV